MLEVLLSHLSPSGLLISLPILYIVLSTLHYFYESYKISRLGYRAARIRTYLPFGLDFIYASIQAAWQNRNVEFWWSNFYKYGNPLDPYNMETRTAGKRIVITADPENIKAVLATQFRDFGKGPQFRIIWHDFLGDSIFTTDGDMWHASRQLIRPQFIKDRVSDLVVFEKHWQVLKTKLGGNGEVVDVADLFFRYTLDAATDFLLGRSVDSLHNPADSFAKAFGHAQHVQTMKVRVGAFYPLVPTKKFLESIEIINNLVNPFITTALSLPPEELESKSKSDSGYTFLHALAGYTRDRTILRDQIVAVLLAGRDTTAITLSWLIYELARRADIVAHLRAEIESTIGWERSPTFEELKSMRYLQHTLSETLRLHPAVPFNIRVALNDTSLPRGGGPRGDQPIGIPAGTPIAYSTLILQQRPDLYPADLPASHLFSPERWDSWQPKPWTYVPFNGGPRICVGQQFALTELGYTLVRLLQWIGRIEPRWATDEGWQGEDGRPEVGEMIDIVLQPLRPVSVALFKA